jgi:hypothetical protein
VEGAPNFSLAGELLLAASGLWPAAPLTRDDADKATKLPKEWADELSTLLSGGPQTKPWRAPPVRYLATWRKLNHDEGSGDLAQFIGLPQIRSEYVNARDRAIKYLRTALQPIRVEDLAGPRLLEPSTSEQQRANSLLAVVGDPGRIVYGLRAGLLSPDYLEALAEVYPAVEDWLDRTVHIEILSQQARRSSYRVPYRAEVVLRVLLGEPPGAGGTVVGSDSGDSADQAPGSAAEGPAAELPDIQIQRRRQDDQTKADRVSDLSPDAP